MTQLVQDAVQALVDSLAYLWNEGFGWLASAFTWLWDLIRASVVAIWALIEGSFSWSVSLLPDGWADYFNLGRDLDPSTPGVQGWGYYFSSNGVAGSGGSSVLTYIADIGWILPVPSMVAIIVGAYATTGLIRLVRWALSFVPTLNAG